MEPKDIRELVELISRSNFQTFELEREGFRLKLVKASVAGVSSSGSGPAATLAPESSVPERSLPAGAPQVSTAADAVASGLHELHSPIVGTFYRAAGPDSPEFVQLGARVKQGQVLCIVEAMKVMNEIESEIDGEIVEILVSNAQPVEYGEVLFRIRPGA